MVGHGGAWRGMAMCWPPALSSCLRMVRAPSIFKLYFGREEATAESFDSEGFFCTGDTGVCEDGCVPTSHDIDNDNDIMTMIMIMKTIPPGQLAKLPQVRLLPTAGFCKPLWGPALQFTLACGYARRVYRILGRTSVDIIKSGGFKEKAYQYRTLKAPHSFSRNAAQIPSLLSGFCKRALGWQHYNAQRG
eukprot:9467404-Pyramimonas_sp.AAC.1